MTPDETTDPAVIRNSWDDDEPAAPTEPRIDLLRAVRDDRQRIWEELVGLRAKVARVEALHNLEADEESWCMACGFSWPCETARALADPAPVEQP